MFENKTIFITGGTGSFGTAFVTDLVKNHNPKKIIVFSRCWQKQSELKNELGNPTNCRWFIGDVRDKDRLLRATINVDILIHAAAIKCIEACTYNPSEAMLTNVQGTQNVIDACIENKVHKCLFISTDKAVAPINTYGASKCLAERLWLNANKYAADDDVRFSVCRYGNVWGSSGSIFPTWKKMISEGAKVLPVTDERMTRFHFMMPDVCKFVEDSLQKMNGGELFIPKLPSVRVIDIAKALDMPYKIIGIRENEKIHEEMEIGYNSGDNNTFLTVDELRKIIDCDNINR